MQWQFALIILVIINSMAFIITKVAADKLPKKAQGIFLQYSFCLMFALIYFLLVNKPGVLSSSLGFLVATGMLNAFGNYFQWRAFEISLSKTVLFIPLLEIVAIVWALIFLSEGRLWSSQLIIGACLCFLAMYIFRSQQSSKSESIKETARLKWLIAVLLMVFIFGTTAFLTKYFSKTTTREDFLLSFYIGSFIGASILFLIENNHPIQVLEAAKSKVILILPLSLFIMGSTLTLYWVYQLGGPISLVNPVRGVVITIIPLLAGWFIFKERIPSTKRDIFGFVVAIIGIILVILR